MEMMLWGQASLVILLSLLGFFLLIYLTRVFARAQNASDETFSSSQAPHMALTTEQIQEIDAQCQKYLEKKQLLEAIRFYREQTNCSLVYAKNYVEQLKNRF